MIKKQKSITDKLAPVTLIAAAVAFWQALCSLSVVPRFMLPSPLEVGRAFAQDFPELVGHSATTLSEAFIGLFAGIVLAFSVALAMDRFSCLYKAAYPLLILSQTVPSVAIAPLLVLWLGYGILPKIALIVIVCFFPVTIGFLDGFRSADADMISLMRTMGAGERQIFRHVKLPSSLNHFFAGLKISVSYSVVGAVIAEWLGGYAGLGVYMTRVKKSYAFDRMFAVILLVSLISLALMSLVSFIERRAMPYRRLPENDITE